MSSFRTVFRTVVMLATLGLVGKAWYHYGPTLGELQAIGGRVVQVANEAWTNYWQSPEARLPLAADDQTTLSAPPALFVPPTGPVEPTRLPPATNSTAQIIGNRAAESAPPAGILSAAALPATGSASADPLQTLRDRLTRLGAEDQQLAPWGSRGEWVRFQCSVPWGGSARYTRHFEAVAETPLAAVEQVVAEIEVWHGAR